MIGNPLWIDHSKFEHITDKDEWLKAYRKEYLRYWEAVQKNCAHCKRG